MNKVLLAVLVFISVALAASRECEVCNSVLGRFESSLSDADKKLPVKDLDAKLAKLCEDASKESDVEQKFCYYLSTIRQMAVDPIKNGVPSLKVCSRLAKKDGAICELRYPKKTDLSTITNPSSLKVKEIKEILAEFKVKCDDCIEKPQFVKKLTELLESHKQKEL